MVTLITAMIILVGLWLCFMVFVMPILAVILGLNVDKADKYIEEKRNKNEKEQ